MRLHLRQWPADTRDALIRPTTLDPMYLPSETGDFDVPADGCASYHSLNERLAHREADTHRYIHLQDSLLFPAVTAEP